MKLVKVAIVGAGYMAQEHAKAFSSLPDVQVVGVHSRTREKAVELASIYGAAIFDSIEEMYSETKADIVVGAVPELSMAKVAKECFLYPWICLLEKPVGTDYQQAQEILAAANLAKVQCYVALNRRSYSATQIAISQLENDKSPRIINILDQQDMDVARALEHPEEVVQKWMFANSVHLVDYINVFARGKMVEIKIITPWNQISPGSVVAAIHFDSGDLALYQASWNGPGPWSVSVATSEQRLELRPLEKLTIQLHGSRSSTEQVVSPDDVNFKPGLLFQAKSVVARFRGHIVNLPTLSEANGSMYLVEQIYGLAPAQTQNL